MPNDTTYIGFIIFVIILIIVVGFIGNKIVDKTTDHIRNNVVHKKNAENPAKSERLADRYDRKTK